MKKFIVSIVTVLISASTANAHYLWVETESSGQQGREHLVRVHFGEYTYGVIEDVNGEAFPAVAGFKLWLVSPNGDRNLLTTTAARAYYQASFTPEQPGTYTLVLENNEVDVIDYTQYDFGIFKAHYNATARVQVEGPLSDTRSVNPGGLTLKRLSSGSDSVRLQVVYKDNPLANAEVKIYVSDLWSKTLESDPSGEISFYLPWQTTYIAEATMKEETPGIFKGDEYEFIWHCATFCIKN
jgi:hypothetical protein